MGVCQINGKARWDNAKCENNDRYVLVGDQFPIDRIGSALCAAHDFCRHAGIFGRDRFAGARADHEASPTPGYENMKGRIDALSAMGWQMVFGSVCLAAIAFMTEDVTAIDWNWSFVVSLVGMALSGTALAYWLWYRILGEVPLNRANVFRFLVPVFGLTIGVIFYQESFEGLSATGVGLIILGIVLVNRRKESKNNQNVLRPDAFH